MKLAKSAILVVNAGSATLKFKIFDRADFSVAVWGLVERIGLPGSFIDITNERTGQKIHDKYPAGIVDHAEALRLVFSRLDGWRDQIGAVGHRVVHGGEAFTAPTVITTAVLKKLEKFNSLAPLHNPKNIAGIKAAKRVLPGVKHVAVFDTAYYKTIPDYAYHYAIPYRYFEQFGIRRYGFHGISHQYVAEAAAQAVRKPLNKLKIISCHLGSGCSITATKFGRAVETSMGFTPLEGLVMGTRSGDLDPSVAFFLMRKLKLSLDEIEEILNKKSGLLGLFGVSNDLRDLLIAAGYKIGGGYRPPRSFTAAEIRRARLALQVFVYRIVRYIGSYALVLGGADYLVFTAGTGERNADIRRLIAGPVLALFPKMKILVVPTNEELMIARQTKKLIKI